MLNTNIKALAANRSSANSSPLETIARLLARRVPSAIIRRDARLPKNAKGGE